MLESKYKSFDELPLFLNYQMIADILGISTYTYKKGLDDSEKIAEDVALNKMDSDHNWKRII